MTSSSYTDWQIEPDADDAAAAAIFNTDRAWNGYSLCDLEPPLRSHTTVAVARRGPAVAACMILCHPAFVSIVPHGDPAGIAAIFSALDDLPSQPFLLARDEHLVAIAPYYAFDQPERMQRMICTADRFQPPAESLPVAERLDTDDLLALQALYAPYPASAFNADQLAHVVFYGVRDGNALLAAAGTHALAPRSGMAAVGNIFTQPEARGRGYGLATTTAVVETLLQAGFRDVILNVAEANPTAARLYTRLGFRTHCRYWEGQGYLRNRAG